MRRLAETRIFCQFPVRSFVPFLLCMRTKWVIQGYQLMRQRPSLLSYRADMEEKKAEMKTAMFATGCSTSFAVNPQPSSARRFLGNFKFRSKRSEHRDKIRIIELIESPLPF